jgi:hypothetical protein
MYNDDLKRTTIMADEQILERLHIIARREGISLAEVIRQALDLRVSRPVPNFQFIGAGMSTEEPRDTARTASEVEYEPRSWR